MSKRSTEHATFVVERTYRHPIERVFAAWADPAVKAQWFAGPAPWTAQRREGDFQVGGQEIVVGVMSDDFKSAFQAYYLDIVPDERIVYSYTMHLNDKKISASLATVEFLAVADGTRMVFTEQGAYLDGYDDGGSRERGSKMLVDNIGAVLDRLFPVD